MNNVTQFFSREGLAPVEELFLGSDFALGWRISSENFTLVYRQEAERLLICDFEALGSDGKSLLALFALLRRAIQSVPTLRYIDAMILECSQDPLLNHQRYRLAELMYAEGAKLIVLDGEYWLRYECR
jgi:hypothetical protein